jgi:1-acyl-sn-glycerol-3-phosphate acyltransferase
VESGEYTTPVIIYPEGATKRQTELIQFKPGAFKSLCSVQPFSLKYDSIWGIQPQSINGRLHTTFWISCCMPPFGTILHKRYPVFRPNQYFWDHHWEPVKDKETKAFTYMRVIRDIMLKEDKFNDSTAKQEDQFCYSAACKGEKFDPSKEA